MSDEIYLKSDYTINGISFSCEFTFPSQDDKLFADIQNVIGEIKKMMDKK